MVATVKLDLGRFVSEMTGRAIILNGHSAGKVAGDGHELSVTPGFNIISLGHGVNQTNPLRFQSFDGDHVTLSVVWEENTAIGGVLGGRYSLRLAPQS